MLAPRTVHRLRGCLALVVTMSCAKDETTGTPGGRVTTTPVLAIAANPRGVPTPQASDYVAALDSSLALGARGFVQTVNWSVLEPDSANLNVQQLLSDVRYARSRGLTVYLGIQTISTVKREVPAGLSTVAWDDPRMMARFDRLLTALEPILGDVTYLAIGNEVAGYLGRNAEWPAYTRFLTQVVAAAHRRNPAIRVSASLEYVEAASQTTFVRALINISDVALFTLYPFQLGGFTVAPPTISGVLFDNMLTLAGTKPVVIQELGYPASSLNSSTDAKQAAFFSDAIAAWRARKDRMPFVSVFLLHDLTEAQCADLVRYYALSTPSFQAFLCSRGLRRVDGTPRPSWDALRTATAWLRTP